MAEPKSMKVFVYVSGAGRPWPASAHPLRSDVVRWADTQVGLHGSQGSDDMKKWGWRIVKMMLVPLPRQAGKEGVE